MRIILLCLFLGFSFVHGEVRGEVIEETQKGAVESVRKAPSTPNTTPPPIAPTTPNTTPPPIAPSTPNTTPPLEQYEYLEYIDLHFRLVDKMLETVYGTKYNTIVLAIVFALMLLSHFSIKRHVKKVGAHTREIAILNEEAYLKRKKVIKIYVHKYVFYAFCAIILLLTLATFFMTWFNINETKFYNLATMLEGYILMTFFSLMFLASILAMHIYINYHIQTAEEYSRNINSEEIGDD